MQALKQVGDEGLVDDPLKISEDELQRLARAGKVNSAVLSSRPVSSMNTNRLPVPSAGKDEPGVPVQLRTAEEGSDLRLGAPLDPEGVTLATGPALYGDLLRGLAQAIADCVAG